jgi:mannose-6-phosphate isomerase-like protein (cupin superfamily)
MKYVLTALFGFGATMIAVGGDLPGFKHWSNTELKGYEKKLAAKTDDKKIGSEAFGSFGNNAKAQISHREGNGEAEVHEMVEDFFVVESGEATLVVGGKVENEHQSAPNELRGPSIKGGEKKKLVAGDIVCIPAKMPHQLFVENGKQFTYFVLKVTK